MKAVVVKGYRRPYDDPIVVQADEPVTPDFGRHTDVAGWVWCTATDGRAGWTPRAWLRRSDSRWHITRDFNAIELSVEPGDPLQIELEESGFFLVSNNSGETGWVPCDHVLIVGDTDNVPMNV